MKSLNAPTTAQSLGALLKSARDIMRKDKGLNDDLDRLPMLTWIMFLKILDDLELQREGEAKFAGKKLKPAIEPPYRWRDWAAKSDGITGDELLAFINQEECTRPDGKRGAGLFAYLRKLTNSNGDDKREVIATVFGGVDNRMKSGYLLRDVINKIGGIHFTSSGELHTLGALYESMLREMRDAAGDSGEFYTPRAVVRFMVTVTNPRLGETVLDPANGMGGFLVEAFNHLSQQVKTVADRKILQGKSLLSCDTVSEEDRCRGRQPAAATVLGLLRVQRHQRHVCSPTPVFGLSHHPAFARAGYDCLRPENFGPYCGNLDEADRRQRGFTAVTGAALLLRGFLPD